MNLNVVLKGLDGEPIEQLKRDKRGKPVTEPVLDDDGKPVPSVDDKGNVVPGKFDKQNVWEQVFLKDVIGNAIGNRYEELDKEADYAVMQNRGKLARKIISSSTTKYTPDEMKTIEEFIGSHCGPIVAAHYDEIKNGDEPNEAAKGDDQKSDAA